MKRVLVVFDIEEDEVIEAAMDSDPTMRDDPSIPENDKVLSAIKTELNWVHDSGIYFKHIIDITGTEGELFGGDTEDKLIKGCIEDFICQVNPGNVVHFIAGPVENSDPAINGCNYQNGELELKEGEDNG